MYFIHYFKLIGNHDFKYSLEFKSKDSKPTYKMGANLHILVFVSVHPIDFALSPPLTTQRYLSPMLQRKNTVLLKGACDVKREKYILNRRARVKKNNKNDEWFPFVLVESELNFSVIFYLNIQGFYFCFIITFWVVGESREALFNLHYNLLSGLRTQECHGGTEENYWWQWNYKRRWRSVASPWQGWPAGLYSVIAYMHKC